MAKEQEKINAIIVEKLGPYSKEVGLLQMDLNKGGNDLDQLSEQFEKEIRDLTTKKGKEKLDKLFKKLKF